MMFGASWRRSVARAAVAAVVRRAAKEWRQAGKREVARASARAHARGMRSERRRSVSAARVRKKRKNAFFPWQVNMRATYGVMDSKRHKARRASGMPERACARGALLR